MNNIKQYGRFVHIIAFAALVQLSHLFRLNWIIGSYTAIFSGINIMLPLGGAFGGIAGSIGMFMLGLGTRLVFFGGLNVHLLAFHVPGLVASLYWSTSHWLIRLVVPAVCIVLFGLHPVGFAALPYAFYWLIPITLYFVSHKNLFTRALGSTLTAHAVGSVIWLYTMPMTPATWLALIPVVAIERVLFASGMVLAYKGLHYIARMRTNKKIYIAALHRVSS